MTRDGPRGPVNAAAKHVNLKGVRARCACSRHVACNMVGSAPVDDGRGGQSDHSGKRALSLVTFTLALIFGTLFSPPMHFNPSQAMFSDGLATICAARFEQLCGSRATFYFCVSTLTICESMSRPRGVVTPEELSCVLKPFDESAKVSESKLHKGNALKHVALLTALHERVHTVCCDNGFQATGRPIRDVAGRIEGLETMTNRLQNLCRTVSQSLRKNPSSEFASTFPWSPTATDTAAEPGYTVVYDRELRLAWRRSQDGTGPAEMSSPLFAPEGAQPTDSPMARWSDGFEHTVTDITCEELRATAAADNKRDMPTVVWEGIHCASKHRVFVKRRQDRTLLMSLFEQGPQICQIRTLWRRRHRCGTSCSELHDEAWQAVLRRWRGQVQSQTTEGRVAAGWSA